MGSGVSRMDWKNSQLEVITFTRFEKEKLENGGKVLNGFKVIQKNIGKGALSKVHMVQDVKTNKYYALKKMSRSLMKKKKEIQPNSEGKICYVTALDKVMMEIKIMKKLQDPNFICLHAVIDDIEVDAIYLILEYAPRGAIMEWETKSHRYVSRHHALSSSGGLPENVARAAWANLVRGLQLLHSRRVIHRDIKPDNLLQFADGSCKLSDFGVAKMFEEEDQNFPFVSNSQGTFHFFPPESLKDGAAYSGCSADIWAAGITLYIFATGKLPWMPTRPQLVDQLFDMIQQEPLTFPENCSISAEWRALILRIIGSKDEQDRPTLEDILQDPWLQSQ